MLLKISYLASGRTQDKTYILAAAMLQYDVEVATDPQKTPLPGVTSLLCDVTSVARRIYCVIV
jgi:hypothetical protein